jgi:hypothetical protein
VKFGVGLSIFVLRNTANRCKKEELKIGKFPKSLFFVPHQLLNSATPTKRNKTEFEILWAKSYPNFVTRKKTFESLPSLF